MNEGIFWYMPHQKLNLIFSFVYKFIPGKLWIFSLIHLTRSSVKDKFWHLLLIVNRHLQNLKLDNLAITQAVSYKLEVSYRLITVKVFILLLHLENQLVCCIPHCNHHPKVLKDNTIYCPDHFINSVSANKYEAISLISIVTSVGGRPFLYLYSCSCNYPKYIFALMESLRLSLSNCPPSLTLKF